MLIQVHEQNFCVRVEFVVEPCPKMERGATGMASWPPFLP
jgi:hypothetical protein